MFRGWTVGGLALVLAVLAVAVVAVPDEARAVHEETLEATDCPEHPPIRITEDAGTEGFVLGPSVEPLSFTAPTYRPGSGVTTGTGSEGNPYVIENWCISSDATGWPTGGPDQDAAIHIQDTSAHVLIQRNVVAHEGDFDVGIRVLDAENVRIVDNDVTGHAEDGVHVQRSENVRVEGNELVDNGRDGVRAKGGLSVHVADNEIVGNGEAAVRIVNADSSLVAENRIEANGVGIDWADVTGGAVRANTLVANDGIAIDLERTDDVLVRGNGIDGSGIPDAIRLYDADGNTIEGNLITRSANGIGLWVASHGNTIEANTIRSTSGYGIWVSFSWENRIAANTIEDNAWHGIRLGGTGTHVVDNTLAGNDAGIQVRPAGSGATIEGNELASNVVGLAIDGGSVQAIDANRIQANTQAGLTATDVDEPVPADGNWWGDASGPSGGVTDACTGAVANGTGQPIHVDGASVCFDPWLEDG